MTLTSALRSATSALAGNSRQASILAKNIAGVGDPNYVRREAAVSSQLYGTVRVDTKRFVNLSLYDATITSNADATKASVLMEGHDRLAAAQGTDDFSHSPAALMNDLKASIQLAAATPSDPAVLSGVVERGRILASSLNESYASVLSMRAEFDREISSSVSELNSLLSQLKTVNDNIVINTQMGHDVLDSIDIRDQLVSKMSEHLQLKIIPREDNDIIITTTGGLLLFEKVPRSISFSSTPSYGAATTGNAIIIDGVPASGNNLWSSELSGRLGGHFEMRDEVLVTQQRQLDEISRSLIDIFGEEDQSVGGVKAKLVGLFTWSGGPAIPAAATWEVGIASSIAINAAVDSQFGGNVNLLRDGAINGDPDYNYNPTSGTGFSDRLHGLLANFDADAVFDPQAGLSANQSVTKFAAASLDSLNADRQKARDTATYQIELSQQYIGAYQSESGTNLDSEMSKLLEVERAYQASAKLMAVIDELFETFFNSVRV